MEDHQGLAGDGAVREDEAAAVGSAHTVLEVTPVPQGVNRLVLTDLGQRSKLKGRL